MCGTCGCGQPDKNGAETHHHHETESRRVAVELDLLARNNALAEKINTISKHMVSLH